MDRVLVSFKSDPRTYTNKNPHFGYLRRDPAAAGYQHWLDKLNSYGNYLDAEMVRSFIASPEYRARFGPP